MMAAAVSCVSLALMPAHGQRAVFLWVVVLITVITADSPVSEPHLDSTSSFIKNQSTTGSSLTALQSSSYTTKGDFPTLSSGPVPTHEATTKYIEQKEETRTAVSPSEHSTVTSKPELSSKSEPRAYSSVTSPLPWSNLTSQHDPSTLSFATVSSFPSLSLEPSKVAFSDYQADHVIPYPDSETSSNSMNTSQLSPSIAPSFLNTPALLAPSHNFVSPHPLPTMSEPTENPLGDLFPTDSLDIDWGSGDYLETMSYMGSDGADYSLVTKVPTEMFDMDENAERYDTSFPTRVGVSPTSMQHFIISHSPSLTTAHFPTHFAIEPTPSVFFHNDIAESSNIDWSDHFTIEPTDVLLPDMNSLEYYTTQKENAEGGAEQRGNVTIVSVTDITPTISFDNYTKVNEEESSSDTSGSEPPFETTEKTPHTISDRVLEPSKTSSHFDSSSLWSGEIVTSTAAMNASVLANATADFTEDVLAYSSLTDVHWFVTEPFVEPTVQPTPVFTVTVSPSPVSTENDSTLTTFPTTETVQNTTTQNLHTTNLVSNATTVNVTSVPPVIVSDQGTTEDGVDIPSTLTLLPESTEADTGFTNAPTTANITPHQVTPKMTTASDVSNDVSISHTIRPPTPTQAARQYLCSVDKPEYLVKISFPFGATIGYAKSQVRDILKAEFNKSVELQVVEAPPEFVFRVVSGPVVYTAISVINALQRSGRRFLSISPNWNLPDYKYQVHTVLQFVPSHIDVRFCNFSESVGKGLTQAYAEVCRRSKESTNFTVHIVNITKSPPKTQEQLARQPVDIIFTVRGSGGHLMGSVVSNALLKLTMVEFSYYMGFPVLQIAEPFHYPELNTSRLLRSSWVKTVLLGVLDQKMSEKTFQANMERRVASLLGEAMGLLRRVKRATAVGNSSVQVVSASRLTGADHPLEIVYFVEGPDGERIPAVQTAGLLNNLDVQRAAIVLGYRVQGVLAQPVEKVASSPSENVNTNLWIIIGVVIPLLVVLVIISILYWKLCRTDKLEFQPDAMTSMQQRQKSISESRTSLLDNMQPSDNKKVEFSEEDEWDSDVEEYEEQEEEDVKGGKKPLTPTKTTLQTSSEEEEEDYEDEEEEFEEEEDGYDDDDDEAKDQKNKTEEKILQTNLTKPKIIAKSNKEEKTNVQSKERRAGKELQTSSVKGFDFAKLHLGQQSKDDVMVIQEPSGPAALPMSIKDGRSPSENGEIPTPVSKASTTKASHTSRRRERISPSDGDSVVTDHSSEREPAEDNLRGYTTPNDCKHTRKNRIGPPPMNGTAEQLSSASIFEHVDRMSRATDAGRRPNKVQLIAMQPMSVPPLHSPTANGKLTDADQMNREIQVALRQKSEIEHHRNKIRLRAKRKGHYDFPAMDDMTNGLGDTKEQDHIYQKAQLQIDKILDPDAQMPAIFIEPKKSCRGRRSPKQRTKDPLNGGMMEADKDYLISDDTDAAYRKCPGVNNVAYVSDPDQGPGSLESPSPTDDVFLGPACSPPGHAPPPPPYMPPQPSIEEARQQMHSLLDDAFALVSPTSQGSTAGITLPGVNGNHSSSSPPGHGSRNWGSSYQPLGPFSRRFSDLSPPPVQGLTPRQGLGSIYLPPGESAGLSEQLQPDSLYSSRGLYADEVPSSVRPRPVGGTTGSQLHHLTQVGLSNRINGYPAGARAAPGQNGGNGWNPYHDNFSRAELEKDAYLDYHDYSVLQMARGGIRESSALSHHLDTSGVGYLSAPPPLDTAPPTHSSASLIKAIREELLRLSQKQAAVSSYHS